mmetsp:Transcript_10017/g.18259  ORF Transcript_10017/g.18259 Transcript_10017/m.18259 type:complete len:596 (+) Transcript_10017:38-1825(+)
MSNASNSCFSMDSMDSMSTVEMNSSRPQVSVSSSATSSRRRQNQKRQKRKFPANGSLSFPWPFLVLALAVFRLVKLEIKSPLLYKNLRGETNYYTSKKIYIPPSLDAANQRRLSLDLGNGNCKWQPPTYDVPESIDFHKTIIAGFPSGDKRMIFIQMEALAGWPAKDEWDFEYKGITNHPFIKANYPHHEGIWGWGDVADQVVMMIRNIRRSMVEYHDILWDIGYAKTWEQANEHLGNLYTEAPPLEDFYAWRDKRVLDECNWYGWFIDYWMEGGLMRDIFTHKITTPEHWEMLMQPTIFTRAELQYDRVVGDKVVTESYDPHCINGDVSGGCKPIAVISAEKLRDFNDGPEETAFIANVLKNDNRIGKYVIAPEAWNCIWKELIQRGKGLPTVYQRPGFVEDDYNFSREMLEEMVKELDRLIGKYGGSAWNSKPTANRIVKLLKVHLALIQRELGDVISGRRKLTSKDFLGPEERRRLQVKEKEETGNSTAAWKDKENKDSTEYFNDLEHKAQAAKRKKRRDARVKERVDKRREARKLEQNRTRVEDDASPVKDGETRALVANKTKVEDGVSQVKHDESHKTDIDMPKRKRMMQ